MKYINDIGTQSKVRNGLLSEIGLFKFPVVRIFLIQWKSQMLFCTQKLVVTVSIKAFWYIKSIVYD